MKLITKFNALPRKPKNPSGRFANVWHFDLRYVYLEPGPAHVLYIVHPGSQFVHVERLPIDAAKGPSNGLEFFPEVAEQAAPPVAKALIYAFVHNLGQDATMGENAPPAFAPWKLMTDDRALAVAVGQELRKLGVRAEELFRVGVTSAADLRMADTAFEGFFDTLKKAAGLAGIAAYVLDAPTSIGFANAPPEVPVPTNASEMDVVRDYVHRYMNARPPLGKFDKDKAAANIMHEWAIKQGHLDAHPLSDVRQAADAGDPAAAFDCGMRFLFGYRCSVDRCQARRYLMKVVVSNCASDELKSTAHSVLVQWYLDSSRCERQRYIFAACHHAEQALTFARKVTPAGVECAAPAVLMFLTGVYQRFAPQVPALILLYKLSQEALDGRLAEINDDQAKMETKRAKQPNRYRCANPGCPIMADHGRMLSKCAGKCDEDKKPYYCGKDCQRADWKTHKLFCRPGAPSSVADTDTAGGTAFGTTKQGTLQVPVHTPDGRHATISSSTMDAAYLRDFAAAIQNMGGGNGRNLTVDIRPLPGASEEHETTLEVN
ncbi:hypothetical protein FISHEDRAFT_45299 [Fistulina hepatica ATCC 64428]|uniref:MYND-type domain-containing protein n=1 Tax=Fistulina hepatica ATCC 64428 TaxID=1128425 RepID=A0A0D7A8Z7_9AGAR|nr:hypothetical protein FISHEDRAFT_45299 [Fistulina hepatica ATCC 64428]